MPAPVIRKLPTPPNRQNAPAVFAERADAFLGALPQLGEDIDASTAFVNEQAAAADTSAQAAKASENAAEKSRTNAAQSAAASEASRQSALVIAAAVGDDVGLPSLSGNAGRMLTVSRQENGVEWGMNTATQQQAEEGVSDEVLMTPLRTRQYVDKRRGAANGVASLDASSKVPSSQLNLNGYAQFYTGGGSNETDLPIGSIVILAAADPVARNVNVTAKLGQSSGHYEGRALISTAVLSGTWRSRGIFNANSILCQRVA